MSFGVELTSSPEGHEDANNERLDLIDPTAPNWSLPSETFSEQLCLSRTRWCRPRGKEERIRVRVRVCGRDLVLSAELVDKCATVERASTRHVTFLCGRGGVYAIGAVVANLIGDHQRRDLYLNLFLEVAQEKALSVGPEEGGFGMSYDLLYGRAGFLWAALFINKYLGQEKVPSDLLMPVVDAVLAGGRAGASDNPSCPLMYRWHGTRFPHSGNYPSSEGNPRDKFVHWSHGAAGMAITLCRASQVFPGDREFRDAAIEAGEVVWKNGLLKKVGLADGVAGNAYAFLSLYRLTGETIYEGRAKAFASFLYHNGRELVTVGDTHGAEHAYSPFSRTCRNSLPLV
ncbi:lanC-like protein GCL1 [Prunus yedoensis var. nudiflora]|uniref:LanC-like protein GCL1 n=1 Tax=Prunus yedoensis var. nudiflora TaxID=2094558 RepID=A0A314UWU8_PRUYE|nr:lanC-like protein GCL1 [Prunus yedoensis var. nudiflora]